MRFEVHEPAMVLWYLCLVLYKKGVKAEQLLAHASLYIP